MAKFKKGDRVRNLEETAWVPKNATGTVDEEHTMPFVIWDEVTEYAMKVGKNPMRRAINEEFLELIEEPKNTNDPLGIIGKKMKGFKFETMIGRLSYDMPEMDNYIGLEAEIVYYDGDNDFYKCQFHDDYWYYPAELIKDHLVDTPQDTQQDTPQELTLLEKFEQGWEIKHKTEGSNAVQVIKSISNSGYIIEWDKGGVHCYIGIESYITCTPPKERKTLYVHLRTKVGQCFISQELLTSEACELINTIHLEKTDGKWNVIK